MDRNYLLTYKDNAWIPQYAWFETEDEVMDFLDCNVIHEVIECIKIDVVEDITEKCK